MIINKTMNIFLINMWTLMPVLVMSALTKAPPMLITMNDLLSWAAIVAMAIAEVMEAVDEDKLSYSC